MEANSGAGNEKIKRKKEVKETIDCSICYEACNNSTHKKIECTSCNSIFCKKCVETYILTTFTEPDCMNCHKIWDTEFVRNIMTKAFCDSKLKKHREDILYDKEKSLLPGTQVYIERIHQRREIFEDIRKLTEEKNILNDKINELALHASRIMSGEVSEEKHKYVRKCPAPECRGFLSSAYKCGTCNIWACPDCKELKGLTRDAEHTCDPEILSSVKAIETDSKPCPNCASLIFKIEGCSQIFCTECTTVFDWRTGKINVGGPIHNPHYFEWVKKNGGAVRPIGDVPCGGIPNYYGYERAMKKSKNYDIFMKVYRITAEIIDRWIPKYDVVSNIHNNRNLRISYLLKQISEDEFKRQLQIREKKHSKNMAVRQVLDTYVAVAIENMNSIIAATDQKLMTGYLETICKIKDYTNECMKPIAKLYSCRTPMIFGEWESVIAM